MILCIIFNLITHYSTGTGFVDLQHLHIWACSVRCLQKKIHAHALGTGHRNFKMNLSSSTWKEHLIGIRVGNPQMWPGCSHLRWPHPNHRERSIWATWKDNKIGQMSFVKLGTKFPCRSALCRYTHSLISFSLSNSTRKTQKQWLH